MKKFFVACLCLMPGQVLALSCMQPLIDISVSNTPDAVVVLGTVAQPLDEKRVQAWQTVSENMMTGSYQKNVAPPLSVVVDVKRAVGGAVMAGEQKTITMSQVCYGPWCGSVGAALEIGSDIILVFNESTSALEVNPCGGSLFPPVSADRFDEMSVDFFK